MSGYLVGLWGGSGERVGLRGLLTDLEVKQAFRIRSRISKDSILEGKGTRLTIEVYRLLNGEAGDGGKTFSRGGIRSGFVGLRGRLSSSISKEIGGSWILNRNQFEPAGLFPKL